MYVLLCMFSDWLAAGQVGGATGSGERSSRSSRAPARPAPPVPTAAAANSSAAAGNSPPPAGEFTLVAYIWATGLSVRRKINY